jgi:hypothetical protein
VPAIWQVFESTSGCKVIEQVSDRGYVTNKRSNETDLPMYSRLHVDKYDRICKFQWFLYNDRALQRDKAYP